MRCPGAVLQDRRVEEMRQSELQEGERVRLRATRSALVCSFWWESIAASSLFSSPSSPSSLLPLLIYTLTSCIHTCIHTYILPTHPPIHSLIHSLTHSLNSLSLSHTGATIPATISVERFDVFKNAWTVIGDLPFPVTGCALVSFKGALLMVGGENRELYRRTGDLYCMEEV
jgi:hypothetical protein